ncbi:MAG TPA: SUMF1/EgtB/PvdO family nonheme iron enzyme, partial [Kofleriaceae bacterium]|nr:SUMF1/EgtB/PvdO family nonheme iron enzyme [Kofleriaceae bacterium]
MTDWQDTLRRAATSSAAAMRELPAIVDFLTAAEAGRATAQTVASALGDILHRRSGFIDSIDAALRGGSRTEPALSAARAVLFHLPMLFDRIVALAPSDGVDADAPLGVRQTLPAMVAHEQACREAEKTAPRGSSRCPRCGSYRVTTRRSEGRFVEIRCEACGNYGSWSEGDADGEAWEAADDKPPLAPTTPIFRWPTPIMASTLVTRFIEYLRGGARDPREIARALVVEGFSLEGELVTREGWYPLGDRRVFVGRRPPGDAGYGELWFDTIEVMLMVRIERPAHPAPRPVWLAIRPVARWQFRAFVAAARIVSRSVQVEPPEPPFAPARLTAGPDAGPMTGITNGEACLYAHWFGKTMASAKVWEGAAATLGSDLAGALWTPRLREWSTQRTSGDESLRVRLGHDTWSIDPDDEFAAEHVHFEEPDPATRVLVDEQTLLPDLGFRT